MRTWLIHLFRVTIFALILLTIRFAHQQRIDQPLTSVRQQLFEHAAPFFPETDISYQWSESLHGISITNSQEESIGHAIQTSPASDSIIGYTGPTNTIIVFDNAMRIIGIKIIDSDDTSEHVDMVNLDEFFVTAYNEMTWDTAGSTRDIDAVSGATLTSAAVMQGIAKRLGGTLPSLKFPEAVTLSEVQPVLDTAATLTVSVDDDRIQLVKDASGQTIGLITRTSPTGDSVIGYQGPTDTLIVMDPMQRVKRLVMRKSYETPHYAGYIREDYYFPEILNNKTLKDIAQLELDNHGLDGVSGATMTSTAMLEAVIRHAKTLQQPPPRSTRTSGVSFSVRDVGTIIVVFLACIIGFSRLKGRRYVRACFQIVLVVYLGIMNGDLISQALVVGWAKSNIPWQPAPGIVCLVAAAFLIPMTSRKQIYCHHLCPHGALQQLIKNAIRTKPKLPAKLVRILQTVPFLLTACMLIIAATGADISLTLFEAFDAYLITAAALASVFIAIIGLALSLFVPMAYCRFGCPTGAVLSYIRRSGSSDRLGMRDAAAIALLAIAYVASILAA